MQAKYIIITALLVAAVVAVCGCSTVTPTATPTPAPASQYPMTLSDYYGRTATLTHAPERIVSTSAANTEILFDLGLGSKIVGVDEYSDYPAEAKNITHVSGFAEVSYEKITAANPDVIFAEDIIGEEAVTKLRDMGFQVIEVKNSNLTMIRKNIELFGKATNTSDKAAALVNSIDAEVANVSAKTAGLNESQKPKVLLVTGLFPDETIYPFGNGTYGDELLTLAGARNAAGNITLYGVMSHEVILKEDPDMIIVPVDDISRPSYNAFKNGSMAWATGLSAYKNGKVYEVDANIMNRPSPRLADAGLIIARIVHPELFQ
jgi:iron complex transport system substrate-binding protein